MTVTTVGTVEKVWDPVNDLAQTIKVKMHGDHRKYQIHDNSVIDEQLQMRHLPVPKDIYKRDLYMKIWHTLKYAQEYSRKVKITSVPPGDGDVYILIDCELC